mmetsp:Transcript_93436/g.166263  ORF Transcript_93436/g.166263 Transcript_93436/m.166263 type:complete len:249 (+) Transcript_93436:55-801(+)|eukprot:CAMPEP_0197658694 /NCGR_PEP_ID=MMETSP1338-20131121/45386_1 /TAXON_ID=43686 ORGANISM="Pelagodinium beii, Strain RCC1491" /NCGR_SAMPLE_ID=MMETSP1338 /ASSEMBLY_ACC=CAM_ASM_000754 /LENGTH=248 /DNA_ID=CAMNT_0043235321 /DNA_START=54 /DNA_END=800 /DNA_ORIENTATION=+
MGGAMCCLEGVAGPPPKPKKLTLKYFPIAGRAEVIRLALILGKLDCADQRLTGEEWEKQHKATAPFGQLPVLMVDGKELAQTKAILRYVGKLAQYDGRLLYPQDPWLAAKVDEVMDAFDDLWILLAPTYRIENQQQKEQTRQRLFAPGGEAARLVAIFEQLLSRSSNGFVVPEAGLTVADLMYFSFLNVVRSGFVEGLPSSLFAGYPNLMKHKEKIANVPEIKKYYVENAKVSNPLSLPNYEVFAPGR